MITLYGIKNCDSVKKAKKWLEQHQIDYQFHDFRQDGLTQDKVENWLNQIDWQILLNKRGTTYRQLTDEVKQSITADNVATLLTQNSTLIKRPVVEFNNQYSVGFSADKWAELFNQH